MYAELDHITKCKFKQMLHLCFDASRNLHRLPVLLLLRLNRSAKFFWRMEEASDNARRRSKNIEKRLSHCVQKKSFTRSPADQQGMESS